MFFRFTLFVFLLLQTQLHAQSDTIISRLGFEMDYRFRAEQDWNSKRSDGTLRDDRSRLRYRFRIGSTYTDGRYTIGVRLRTGEQKKQQDPQLTLGKGLKEFGTLPIGFERIYVQGKWNNIKLWAGKNTYPFEKSNELFWSDNVFPEGVAAEQIIKPSSSLIEEIKLVGGHFILGSNDGSFSDDAYLTGVQTSVSTTSKAVTLFPSLYVFRNIPNIPDGDHTSLLNYTLLHLGARTTLFYKKMITFEVDFYHNIENYKQSPDIPAVLQSQNSGYVIAVGYGKLKAQKDWLLKLTYTHLERYAIVDYMAQNDWARWDYAPQNSPDGRLSNLRGLEFVAAYAITAKVNLVMKYYTVYQLIPYGVERETGQRIRFDIDMRM